MMYNGQLRQQIVDTYGSSANFSQIAGVGESIISRVIRGRRDLPDSEKERWAKILRCDVQDIFQMEGRA